MMNPYGAIFHVPEGSWADGPVLPVYPRNGRRVMSYDDARTIGASPAKADPQAGVTFIEILVVLVLLGILTAMVITRSTNVDNVDKRVKTIRLQDHIRYAQSLAMKQNTPWGVKSDGAGYWLFSGTNPDAAGNRGVFPSEENTTLSFDGIDSFTLIFDGYGRPYTVYQTADSNIPVSTDMSIQSGGHTTTLSPETGFVQ